MELRRVPAAERRLSALVTLAALAAAALLALAPPAAYPIPVCPFHALTGLFCPGCGTLRAGHHLLGGGLAAAVGHNALFVLLLPLFAFWGLGLAGAAVAGRTWRCVSTPALGWALLAAIVAFWVVRNLPWAAFDVLRPTAGNPLLG